ncbi:MULTISPECIES: IctB family putative bicarbonate transporter [Okeania]|uniref:Putative bicarbonate transporter, IctB family n=2 Tax=Okeania TaxID=1458928 RepID=A0A3N6PM12_9CYAN|nr:MULTISPECIES: IctB family putative bicarbonate transporter [Okeania]NET12621.1 putative bicarbonate transporter, IctB family [Okeania sp. SIO1H6]NES75328.1 putative bicarbonate transporter, IctB family [Okeania sp. SIO1H4]NET19133.1 putative bicarbonate transporter, IctB family [Okeania sp. SIO1H5]NET75007.1 putative bicarbonate transporter, IctB family [Okeania sp. SIO1F9]NET92527.1 putative bicarbonate transporter, IctB family [Okeania sp. SIO1H2]
MNSVWQKLTLTNLSFSNSPWLNASYLYGLINGSLHNWRRGSWLMQWGEALGFVLLAIVFSLAPFVNTALIGLLLLAGAGFWVLLAVSDNTQEYLTPIHLLIFVYWGIATLAMATSPARMAAFSGWVKLTLYLLLFVLGAMVLRSPKLRSWLISIYLLVSLVVSFYGIRQWIDKVEPLATWNDPTSAQAGITRVYSYLGNPNLLGGYLLPAIALSFVAIIAWRSWPQKLLAVTMLLVNCACLRYTGSRGSWIGFIALMFALLILMWYWWSIYMPSFWQTWSLPIAVGSLAGLLILAVVLLEPLRDRVFSIFAGRQDSSNNFRMNVWMSVFDMIRDRPVLGIGPGNDVFNKIYPLYQRPRYSALSAYSVPLEIIVETGFIGFTAFLWLLLVTFNQGVLNLRRLRDAGDRQGYWLIGAMVAMVGLMAHGLVDTVWYRPQINTLWWLMVAIVASYYGEKGGSRQ